MTNNRDAALRDWLRKEMPAGTVIGDPDWWADAIAKRFMHGPALSRPVVPDSDGARLNGAEAVYGFAAWLTCRNQAVTFGSTHDAAPAAQLADAFCKTNSLGVPRDDCGGRGYTEEPGDTDPEGFTPCVICNCDTCNGTGITTPPSASSTAGEAVAWLHTIQQGGGEHDQALSFAPDNFPLGDELGFRSLGVVPLFAQPLSDTDPFGWYLAEDWNGWRKGHTFRTRPTGSATNTAPFIPLYARSDEASTIGMEMAAWSERLSGPHDSRKVRQLLAGWAERLQANTPHSASSSAAAGAVARFSIEIRHKGGSVFAPFAVPDPAGDWVRYGDAAQQLHAQAAEVEKYKVAWEEYDTRTQWVQDTAKPKELGMHRADVLRQRIEAAEAEVERLRNDCGEAYQVIGYGMLGEPGPYTQADVERALDNLSAAVAGDPRPHDDLLPFPKFDAPLNPPVDPATVNAEGESNG